MIIKTWWTIFAFVSFWSFIVFLGPIVLAFIAAFCVFVIAPIGVFCAITGIGFGE